MQLKETKRFLKVVHALRRKCPWDKKQTHKSLIPYLVEEAYETVDAIQSQKKKALKEELGDVLLQVALHSEIEAQKGGFTFEDVAKSIADKMVFRHPHVFARQKAAKNLKAHVKNWTLLKNKEKPKRGMLSGIPRALPALQLSQRYGEIAASVGFDWAKASHVFPKIKEEITELEAEVRQGNRKKMEMEMGDLLFALCSLARHLKIDAERALRLSAEKFSKRFEKMEAQAQKQGTNLADLDAQALEALWEKIKKR